VKDKVGLRNIGFYFAGRFLAAKMGVEGWYLKIRTIRGNVSLKMNLLVACLSNSSTISSCHPNH